MRTAPLAEHLREVNVLWRSHRSALAEGPLNARFQDEAQRITAHLTAVAAHLRENAPVDLSSEQLAARTHLLGRLEAYAQRGLFPTNEVLPYRNPVFIDAYGTACAVGQLIIESGHHALAQRLDSEMKCAYILDMQQSELAEWAHAHGFAEAELAWIQPTYSPQLSWAPLAGGTNGAVHEMLALANGHMLLIGDFDLAGGTEVNGVALWDGSTYTAWPALPGETTCAVEHNGEIFVGGNYNGYQDIARWTGSSWAFGTVGPGKYPLVSALSSLNGELYAGAQTVGFAGTEHAVYKRVGNNWQQVGGDLNGRIEALATFGGDLVAAGEFTGVYQFGEPDESLQHVALLENGNWTQLADGLNAPVYDLVYIAGTLHAGGLLFSEMVDAYGLARIAPGSSAWEMLLPNKEDYLPDEIGIERIASMVAIGDTLYLGGAFRAVINLTEGSHIARFLGEPDQIEVLASLNDPVNDVEAHDQTVTIGGAFSANGLEALPYVATLAINTSLRDLSTEGASLLIWPVPATHALQVQLSAGAGANAAYRVLDATGRTIAQRYIGAVARFEVDIAALAPGTYTLHHSGNAGNHTARFLKQ
jgi:hypothetical protein